MNRSYLTLPLCLLAGFAAACSDDDDDDNNPASGPSAPSGDPLSVYVSNNDGTGEVDQFNQVSVAQNTTVPGNNEGVVLDHVGNLYQGGDVALGTVRIFNKIAARASLDAFSLDIDRELGGALTTLVSPKGIAVAHAAGLLLIADFGASAIVVFGTAAGGDVAPLATTPLTAAPWDLAYDQGNDRLFVAQTDGTVAVFDGYAASVFAPGAPGTPNRVIIPGDGVLTQISVNLHGIALDVGADRLVVSDVGDTGVNDDGAIFTFENASTADGNLAPDRTITGPLTMLGNPVDIALDGEELRVAEKGNDLLLLFTDVFSHAGGDVAPQLSVAETDPESLVLEPSVLTLGPDVSDIDDFLINLDGLLTTANPDAGPEIGDLYRLELDLTQSASFNTDDDFLLENVTLDRQGDAFVTFDDGGKVSVGGILVVNRLAKDRDGEEATLSRDRAIQGASTLLVSPKGIEVADELGRVLVAENGEAAPSILVFSTTASGDVAPLSVTALPARPWDLDYDPASDTLFIAMTDGSVAVYDAFFSLPIPLVPDRVITISDGDPVDPVQESVNLHGIVYDAVNDALIVSDIGDPGIDTDGVIYAIQGALTADGLVDPSVRIAGPTTTLGNPVDIAYNGTDLWVAEKANELILRFNNVLVSAGGDLTPDDSEARIAPESVCLIPSDLSPVTGGSIF